MVPPATELAVAGKDLQRLTCGGRADRRAHHHGVRVAQCQKKAPPIHGEPY
jgi:hypothetical protein